MLAAMARHGSAICGRNENMAVDNLLKILESLLKGSGMQEEWGELATIDPSV